MSVLTSVTVNHTTKTEDIGADASRRRGVSGEAASANARAVVPAPGVWGLKQRARTRER
jgi:hypothetical protein